MTTRPNTLILALCLFAAMAPGPAIAGADWPAWRGPHGNGIADGPLPPLEFSPTRNVLWKAPVDGRGAASPTVVGNHVVLPSADEGGKVHFVLGFDRATGRRLWRTDINRGGFTGHIHKKNTHATPTIASDGKRLFVVFAHHESIRLSSLDLDGRVLWTKTVGPFRPVKYRWGYAPSPVLHGSTVIVACETDTANYLVALDVASGEPRWRADREPNVSYASPIVGQVAGRKQLLISGNDRVWAYDPANGRALWSAPGTTKATSGTAVWDGELVFASGGYPRSETVCVRADGSGTVVWKNNHKCYEQSMLATGGHVYAVTDPGIAFCWRAKDGAEQWKARLPGGAVSASPTLVGDRIYVANEKGTHYVFGAKPDAFKLLTTNQLGDEAFASMAICGGRIYTRVAHLQGTDRQEMLYCIGQRAPDSGGNSGR
ncbi:MAG: PQQ-binding-like beta-propeller repeat protein [Phycisphaerae bacterium]|nr:PQQ-binding-like beta-propeller repeat protein [Phycisphaerae bacterium]